MKLDFEYGQGLMSAELPDSTEIFIPGKTVPDPECLPQDWDSLYEATLESRRLPAHCPPEGLHYRLPGGAVRRRCSQRGHSAAVLHRPAPPLHGERDAADSGGEAL